jgi:polyhydroxyalkanoate synthase subunit PhaC
VRNLYLENRMCKPGALTNCGVPVDLSKVQMPLFFLATREDHIVPWRSAYRSVHLLAPHGKPGEKTFVLGASGHIAGVVNPPAKNRRSYWIGDALPADPDEWLAQAEERRGSWWPAWTQWLESHAGGRREAPKSTGAVQYPPIESAPGRYVRQRIH